MGRSSHRVGQWPRNRLARGLGVTNNRVVYWRKLADDYHQLALATKDPNRRLELISAVIRCLQFAEDAALGDGDPLATDGAGETLGEDIQPEPTTPL
jgi:hypothetical protein